MSPNISPKFDAPLYIAWEVSLLCNVECIHCYSSSGPKRVQNDELTTSEAFKIIDELSEAGLLVLAFSGGEPLLRKDIFKLTEYAARKNLVVNVASNGLLINSNMARRLADSGVRSVTISLDGVNASTHDSFRNRPGLFSKTITAISSLVNQSIRVVVSFSPTILNYSEGEQVVELAYSLEASAVNMSEYVPAGRGTNKLSLPPNLLKAVIYDWIRMREEYKDKMQIIWHDCRAALLVDEKDRDKYSGCGAGKLTARIMADGTLTPCVFLSTPVGNLKRQSFKDMWNNSQLLKAIRDRELIGGNCMSCIYKSNCGGCRAVSMANNGNPLMGDASCWLFPENDPQLVH